MELYIPVRLSITLSANILIFNFSCFFKQLPPFPCRFNFCNTPLLQEVQAPDLKFIWKKHFSMFFSIFRLYLTLTTIKTSEFSTLGRCFLTRVRFRYVTNHLKRRHYRVCSPADLSPCVTYDRLFASLVEQDLIYHLAPLCVTPVLIRFLLPKL